MPDVHCGCCDGSCVDHEGGNRGYCGANCEGHDGNCEYSDEGCVLVGTDKKYRMIPCIADNDS